ncbi:YbbR-like domain-containing protein [Parageobacillus sp. VR-IP]|uniref:CdaR family protein n=1 Tax=Parageobacillus sp. VR-IP TaxID=2742205 RepID=UPI0015814825|nr:CdaR family protein [Parageobacillus sp. VR-IP]NUK31873.1 YbbR-like domain-containing protein [Parageobacillus sp. VR-IP]
MDKLMNNHWFIKVFSLLVAIMLYMSANIEKGAKSGEIIRNAIGQEDTETLTNVPVVVYYDEENLMVSGIPKYVNVTLQGPASIVKPTALQRNFEVYMDLTNLPLGTYTVPIKYKDISDKLKVNIQPSTAKVTIREKVSKDFHVGVAFINKNKVPEGYAVEQPVVKPNSVMITGAKELIDSISSVTATVNLEGATDTITQESKVIVYDHSGRVLNIHAHPSIVKVTVPIKSPSKTVPLKINRTGTLPEGVNIVEIKTVPDEVTIFGPKEKIDSIQFIDGLTIHLDEITEDRTLEMAVPLPEGVKSVDPSKVKIHIDVQKEETKTLKDVPIHVLGLGEPYTVEFIDPKEQAMDVRLHGAPDILNDIKEDDVELYIDVSGLDLGEHEVKIKWNGPQNIKWELPKENVKIKISEKNNEQ